MKLLPFGAYLPVHCCCDPNKRLGWVPRFGRARGPATFIAGHPTIDLETGTIATPEKIHTEIETLRGHDDYAGDVLAVKSNEVPIETWRKVPGFVDEQETSRVIFKAE